MDSFNLSNWEETQSFEIHNSTNRGELYTGKSEEQIQAEQIRQKLNVPSEELSDAQALTLQKQLEYLISRWIDDFERNLFSGKTLVEVIHTE